MWKNSRIIRWTESFKTLDDSKEHKRCKGIKKNIVKNENHTRIITTVCSVENRREQRNLSEATIAMYIPRRLIR